MNFRKYENLTNNQLNWRALQPDTKRFQLFFPKAIDADTDTNIFASVQARLFNGLNALLKTSAKVPLLLVRSPESTEYLTLLQRNLSFLSEINKDKKPILHGGHYQVSPLAVNWRPSESTTDNFVSYGGIHQAEWIESEQLFGCVRVHKDILSLTPGLVHRANGGILILSLRALLTQPLMWLRLKKILVNQRFDWYSQNERRSLPLDIPSMPMQFRLVLIGERDALADFQEIEPELVKRSLYSEFEDNIQLAEDKDISYWFQWVEIIAQNHDLQSPSPDFWPILIREATRYSGDQYTLPLDPIWLSCQLHDAVQYSKDSTPSAAGLKDAISTREWREGFLSERIRDDILLNQILIQTEGKIIGQINVLSVVDFPGHPRAFGEPSRISCVVHVGDSELTDVERKAELGGNIHAKGMMIMQAWLISELELEQQLPFSASLVFEQSYTEIDGDSASLAQLCVLISALSRQPINQQLAVTGSVDQFGRVQAVGGLNEKIEGFFHICYQRTLNGRQGVIIPATNIRHLSLQEAVVNAVREKKFHLWAVSRVEEALHLLMGIQWNKEHGPCLLRAIKKRIAHLTQHDIRHRPWFLHWLKWLNNRRR